LACDVRLYDASYASLTASVQLVAVDTSTGPAPTNLTGAVTNTTGTVVAGQLEVVLLRLPPATSGSIAVNTASQLRGYVAGQAWPIEQKEAVLGVALALSSMRGAADPISQYFVQIYEQTLEERRIRPGAF
jgi:hypothetical protein